MDVPSARRSFAGELPSLATNRIESKTGQQLPANGYQERRESRPRGDRGSWIVDREQKRKRKERERERETRARGRINRERVEGEVRRKWFFLFLLRERMPRNEAPIVWKPLEYFFFSFFHRFLFFFFPFRSSKHLWNDDRWCGYHEELWRHLSPLLTRSLSLSLSLFLSISLSSFYPRYLIVSCRHFFIPRVSGLRTTPFQSQLSAASVISFGHRVATIRTDWEPCRHTPTRPSGIRVSDNKFSQRSV